MNATHRAKLDSLGKTVEMAQLARDPFETLSYVHDLAREARALERELERDISDRGREAGLSISPSLAPAPTRAIA